jgi:antitoxin (DNA-binding transcriptional repressor) of toxin-antitoxin stability system
MRTVGIKVLKNKLSEYVRLAAAGETVQVTDRDRVVASWCRRGRFSTMRKRRGTS